LNSKNKWALINNLDQRWAIGKNVVAPVIPCKIIFACMGYGRSQYEAVCFLEALLR
jgi:hypothetical protein